MTIAADRAQITAALEKVTWPARTSVHPSPPPTLAADICYLELKNVEDGTTFGTLKVTWDIVATIPAQKQLKTADALLDAKTDAILAGLAATRAADLENVSPYITIFEEKIGTALPAVRVTVTSQTTIA